MSKPWFHGEIDSEEAYNRLKDKEAGTYLLRFSSRQNNFVISRVVERDGKKWYVMIFVYEILRCKIGEMI